MNLLTLLGALSLLLISALADSTADIFYWPISASSPSVLARVSFDPTTQKSNVVSYNAPSDSTDPLVRIGLYITTPSNPKQWVGSLVSLSSLTDKSQQPTFRLHLGPANELYHVSLAAKDATSPQAELVLSEPGAQPHLNRPVVVGPDGADTEAVEEKSMLQKYWWVLAIVFFLTMTSGGGGE
ncbi:unnamed protein product [Penicillium pancosmium]